MKEELIKLIIENKMPIVMGIQFFLHKLASYWVRPGKKSFKSFVKFVIGKDEA